MKVCTDTATITIFDKECLKHRLNDGCDWWSSPTEEVSEINSGNVFFIGTGADGCFEIELSENLPSPDTYQLEAIIKNPSGQIFIGPGEDVTGEEYEPGPEDGHFIQFSPGNKKLIAWERKGRLAINIQPTNDIASNTYEGSPSII